jgi:hypothetical protein
MRVVRCSLPFQTTGEHREPVGWITLQHGYSSMALELEQWRLKFNLLALLLVQVLRRISCMKSLVSNVTPTCVPVELL